MEAPRKEFLFCCEQGARDQSDRALIKAAHRGAIRRAAIISWTKRRIVDLTVAGEQNQRDIKRVASRERALGEERIER